MEIIVKSTVPLPQTHTLSNGLRVIHTQFKGIDSTVGIIKGTAGAGLEKEGEFGGAHLLEHCLFDGSKKYPTNLELLGLIKSYGGSFNGSTSHRRINYYFKLVSEFAERGFEFLSELLINPKLDPDAIEKEKSIVLQEAISMYDDPVNLFYIDRDRATFSGQRIAKPVIGDIEDIKGLRAEDIINFYHAHYHARNFVFSTCSADEGARMFDYAEKHFSQMPTKSKHAEVRFSLSNKADLFVRTDKRINQIHLEATYAAPTADDDKKYAAAFVEDILGGDLTARLPYILRLKNKLAYSVGTSYTSFSDIGLFDISGRFEEDKFEEVYTLAQQEIAKFLSDGPTDEEISQVRNKIVTGHVFGAENPYNRADLYATLLLRDKFPEINHVKILENYQKVSKEDVIAVAREIFSNKPKIGVLSKNLKKAHVSAVLA